MQSIPRNLFTEPLEFQEKYGHCRVTQKRSKDTKYFSLGYWVSKIRGSYKAV